MIHLFRRRVWWQQILFITAASIFYVLFSGVLGTKVLVPVLGWGGGVDAIGNFEAADSIAGRFARFDSGYYLRIARDGYSSTGTERAFFPLYPIAIRFLSSLTGLSLLWSGLLFSIVCFVVACLYLYKLVLMDHQQEIAMESVLWVCCFPMAFFFIAFYSESLFFLLCICSAYYSRRGHFIASGLAIALAGATRPTAFLLGVILIIEFLQQRNFKLSRFIELGAGALIAPLGVLGYFAFLARISSDGNVVAAYVAIQSAEWHRSIVWPWISLYDGIKAAVFGNGINPDWFSRVIAWHDLTYALLGMTGAIISLCRTRLSFAIFSLSSMVFLYINHGPYGYAFWSIPRYIASLFPIYVILALITIKSPTWLRWSLIFVSIILLGVWSAWFASGRWVA
jgi:Gpi18-like mannosyltransferase